MSSPGEFSAALDAAKAARLAAAERLRAAMALVDSARAEVARAQAHAQSHTAGVRAQDRARFASLPAHAVPSFAEFSAAESAPEEEDGPWEPPYRAPRARLGYTASLALAIGAPPAPRGRLSVHFTVALDELGGSGGGVPENSDFLGLYSGAPPATPTAAHEQHLSVEFTDGALEGSHEISLPSYGGTFCVCYVSACGAVLASSAPFEVAAGAASAAAQAQSSPPPAPAASAAPPLAAVPSFPATIEPTILRPPFLLETQPRISVLQLYVPLPAAARGALPAQWAPRVLIEGDGDGKTPALLVAFKLPAPITYGAGGTGGGGGEGPLYALQLPTVRRVETEKAQLRVAEDHISLRLPFFYTGSALPERPPSLVTVEELSALRQCGWALACRVCGAPLLGGGGLGAPPRAPPRVLQLPSEHWLEWAELWMCHEGQENVLLPRDGEGEHCGLRGALLLGEAHLQPHAADVRAGALLVRPLVAGGGGAPPPPPPAESTAAPLHTLAAECARCGAALGRLATPLGEKACAALARHGAVLLTAPVAPHAPPLPPLLPASALSQLPDALMAGAHPQLRLFKDALWLPFSSPAPRPEAHLWSATAASCARGRGGGGALHAYSLCTRIAVPMLATAQAMCRYRFLLASGGTGGVGAAAAAGQPTALFLTLLNWNTSIRAAAVVEGAAGSGSGAPPRPWGLPGDLPCLKVRFEVLGSGAGGGEARSEGAPEVLELAHAELQEVLSVLRETSQLLPPSARTLEGSEVGFLPFVAAPLKRISG
jgi:hypothetical protein